MPISRASAMRTIWSVGPTSATAGKIIRRRADTFLTKRSVTRILMNMADGAARPITGRSGFLTPPSWVGRHTATVIGFGSRLGVIHGWTMSPGALRLFTMAAGWLLVAPGVGCRAGRD